MYDTWDLRQEKAFYILIFNQKQIETKIQSRSDKWRLHDEIASYLIAYSATHNRNLTSLININSEPQKNGNGLNNV